MKSIKEIITMLATEIAEHSDNIKSMNIKPIYYNEILGDTSFLLASLLESLLVRNFNDWDKKNWIDDSLITHAQIQDSKLSLEGIIIWGKENTTEQWTNPFALEMEFLKDKMSLKRFTFWFCDLDNHEIPYEEFNKLRDYWNNGTKNWKYIINIDKDLLEI